MPATIPNIKIDANTWTQVAVAFPADLRKGICIQNLANSDIFFSTSDTQPLNTNTAYRILKRGDNIETDPQDPAAWIFSPQVDGLVNVKFADIETEALLTAQNEIKASQETPITQIGAEYELLTQTLTTVDSELSGTNSIVDNMFTCDSGTDPLGFASILTLRQLKQRHGQSAIARLTGKFDTSQANSQQACGLITAENAYVFGYIGTSFGIIYGHDGESESQELTITTSAAVDESATITVDGVAYVVPLTIGNAQHNALEIADDLNANVPNYDFSSNDNQVVAQSVLPGPAGTFDFTSATVVASWFQVTEGVDIAVDFIAQSTWNIDDRLTGDTDDILDPQKGNNYQIQLSDPFSGVKFYIRDSKSDDWTLVHMIRYSNLFTKPSVTNPTFRVGWLVRNLGNTTSLRIQGSDAGAFIEGIIKRNAPPLSEPNNQLSIGTILTNIIAVRCRLHFGGKVNRAEIFPLLMTGSTESNKTTIFQIIAEPTFGGDVDFDYVDKVNSIAETAIDAVPVSGGRVIGTITIAPGTSAILLFNERADLDFTLLPSQVFSLAARHTGGAAADSLGSVTWQDDL